MSTTGILVSLAVTFVYVPSPSTETGISGTQRANVVLCSVPPRVALQQPSPRTVSPSLSLAPISPHPLAQCTALAPNLPQRGISLCQQHERRRRRREVDGLLNTHTATHISHTVHCLRTADTHTHTHTDWTGCPNARQTVIMGN